MFGLASEEDMLLLTTCMHSDPQFWSRCRFFAALFARVDSVERVTGLPH